MDVEAVWWLLRLFAAHSSHILSTKAWPDPSCHQFSKLVGSTVFSMKRMLQSQRIFFSYLEIIACGTVTKNSIIRLHLAGMIS